MTRDPNKSLLDELEFAEQRVAYCRKNQLPQRMKHWEHIAASLRAEIQWQAYGITVWR